MQAAAKRPQLELDRSELPLRDQRKRLSQGVLRRIEQNLPQEYKSAKRRAIRESVLLQRARQISFFSVFPLIAFMGSTVVAHDYLKSSDDFQEEVHLVNPSFRKIIESVEKEFQAKPRPLPAPIVFTPPQPSVSDRLERQANLLKFITGMIVVFRPQAENPGEIARHIVKISADHNLDPLFVASVISAESGFRPHAKSPIGALGLMQLRPSTAQEVLDTLTDQGRNDAIRQYLKNPEINIRLGIQYLKQLEQQYRGDRYLALAAYNWGPGNVAKARKSGKAIPGSVQQYATSILERTTRWQRHFSSAQKSAEKLEVKSATLQKKAANRG